MGCQRIMAKSRSNIRRNCPLFPILFLAAVTFCNTGSCQKVKTRLTLPVTPVGLNPIVDGALSEWNETLYPKIRLENLEVAQVSPSGSGRIPTQITHIRGGKWKGKQDLSGWVSLALDPYALYLFGKIRDDQVMPLPSMEYEDWNKGDAIEVFLDTDPKDQTEKETFSADDYQIFLWPANRGGPSWGIMKKGTYWVGKDAPLGGGDGSFEGVEVSFRRSEKEDGYTFEARFPLINFPRLKGIQDHDRLGFNIALGDREILEGDVNKYVYMTWNGKGDLFIYPQNFGTLIVQDPDNRLSPKPPGSPLELGFLFFGLGLLVAVVLFAFLFTWLVRWIASWPLRRKVIVAGSLTLAVVGVMVLGALIRRLSDGFVVNRVEASARKVKEVITECSGIVDDEELVPLLRGLPVDTKKSYRYHFFPVAQAGTVRLPSSSAENASPGPAGPPEYLGDWTGLEVSRSGRTAFLLLTDEVGDRLSVILSASRRPGLDPKFFTPDPSQPVARIYLEDATSNAGTRRAEILLSITSEGALTVLEKGKAPGAIRGFPLPGQRDRQSRTGYALFLDTRDFPRGVAPFRLILSVEDDAHLLQVHGLSTLTADTWRGIPFRIESLADHPLQFVYGTQGPRVSARKVWRSPIRIDRHLDRLWIFFKCTKGYPKGSVMKTRVADVVLKYASGEVHREPLRSGIHLESYRGPRKKHPPRMRTQVALNDVWDFDSGRHVRTRRDVLALALRPGQDEVLESLEIQWSSECKGPEEIEVMAVTGGVSARSETGGVLPKTDSVESLSSGTIQLTKAMRADLDGFRINTSVIPAVTGLLPLHEDNEVVSYIPLNNITGLRLSLELAPQRLIEDAQQWAGIGLLACLLPLVLVLIADALAQGKRLRTKLLLSIGLASMPPLALLVVNLDNEIRSHLEEKVRKRTRTATDLVAGEVIQVRERMRTIARESALDREFRALLEAEAPTDFAGRIRRKLVDLEKRWPESVQQEVEIMLWDAVSRKAYRTSRKGQDLAHTWLLPRVDRSGFYNDFGTILAVGHEPVQSRKESQRWNLFAVRPLIPAFFEELLRDDPEVHAIAFHPGAGYPYAGIGTRGHDHRFSGVQESRTLGYRAVASSTGYASQNRNLNGIFTTLGARMLTDAMEDPILAVGAAVNREKAFSLRTTMLGSALVVGAAMLLLFFIITFLVTRRIIDPLLGLSRAARKLAEGGEETPRIPIHSQDEVGNLTAAFNDMAVQLRKRLRGLDLLNRGMRDLNDRRSVDGILDTVLRIFQEALDPTSQFLALHDPDAGEFNILGGRREGRPIRARRIQAEDSFLFQAMNTGGPELVRGIRWMNLWPQERRLFKGGEEETDLVVTLPLDYQGDPIGLLVLTFSPSALKEGESAPVDRDSLMVLATMADQIAGALENARLYRLAVEDPITGLYLQGYFEGRLKDEIQRASRYDRSLTLIKLRIEEIPIVSTQYGSGGVNQLLKTVSRAVRSVLDLEENFAGRLDNNDFALALPEADRTAGYDSAQRISAALAQESVSLGKGRSLKVAPRIGIATFPEEAASFEFLHAKVDQAMARMDLPVAEADPLATVPEAFEDSGVVLKSPRSLSLVKAIDRIASSTTTVLITGETGTGKEVFAELIHRRSNRQDQPLIKVNCAALPELLLESELFGHERGAFTGAYRKKIGRFERADRGTLFLDEIGEISASTQVKLLRVLQDKKIERLGGTESIDLDVRIIAATNRDMQTQIKEGVFREDLYYRLNVLSFEVPPLRDRKEEIPLLVDFFVREYNQEHGDTIAGIRPQTMDKLHNYNWPGNIRQLKNVLERAMVSVDGPRGFIEPDLIQIKIPRAKGTGSQDKPVSSAPKTPARTQADPTLEPFVSLVSNPRQIELLKYLRQKKTITNQEYFTMMNISQRTGLRDLNDLIQKGLLLRIGSRRGAIYKMKEGLEEEALD